MTDPTTDQPFELKRKHINAIAGTVALFLTLLLGGVVVAVRLIQQAPKLIEGMELVLFLSACIIELFIGVVPFGPLKEVLHLFLDHAPWKTKETPS